MAQELYSNNLPFSQILADNVDDLIKRIEDKKAALIVIEGALGEGKTTLAIHLGDYINKKYNLQEIDLTDKNKPQLSMGGGDFLKKMRTCYDEKLPVIIYDEAGDYSKRGALTQFNAMLNRTFETFRAFKIIVIMCLPCFDVLDQQIIDKQIPRLMLRCVDRTKNYGNFNSYSLYRMNLLKWRMSKMAIKNYAYTTVQPNFRGHFLDLSKDRSDQLDKISTKSKINLLRNAEIKIEGLISYPELALKLGKSIQWTRHAISIFKIKSVRDIGRVKYFDQIALNKLSEHVNNKRFK